MPRPAGGILLPGSIVKKNRFLRLPLVVPRRILARNKLNEKIEFHKMVLSAMGVADIGALGTLKISGMVIPQPGVLVPRPRGSIYGASVMFSSARRLKTGSRATPVTRGGARVLARKVETIGGRARLLKAKAFPLRLTPGGRVLRYHASSATAPRFFSTTMPLDRAYWAAQTIEIANDTTIVLQQPHRYLVIIAENIRIGDNVTITWEREARAVPGQPEPPAKPPKPARSIYLAGIRGQDGERGGDGGEGPDGGHGPEIEIWTLDMTGSPAIDVAGQDGFRGGNGGDGAPGGDGADGRNWIPGLLSSCKSGPGNGGDGGRGGDGGDGGPGGDGGNGGRFSLYAPDTTLRSYSESFYVDASAGTGGRGGARGRGGRGGAGGRVGADRTGIFGGCPTPNRTPHDGASGADGRDGGDGADGPGGTYHDDAVQLKMIDNDIFNRAFNKPAIITLSADGALEGETVSINGLHFSHGDVVTVDGVDSATTVLSDTLISFVVPMVQGGKQKAVQVRQSDGTLSNRASLNIHTEISRVVQDGRSTADTPPARFRPGTEITIQGKGFAGGAQVRVLDEYITGADVRYVDPHTIVVSIIRPSSTPPGREGESVQIQVLLDDGTASNNMVIQLDTYVILVLGDSVMWGQGLREDLKFHSIVERHIRETIFSGGIYKEVLAHSGAVIGVGDNITSSALNGEVPTRRPTILQQVDLYNGAPQRVDLVLLNGSINDVGVEQILNPVSTPDIPALAAEHCYDDMMTLLEKVTDTFPNARVIATGYYQIVSNTSDLTRLTALLAALGFLALGPGGVLAGTLLSHIEKDHIVAMARSFREESDQQIARAVQDTNTALGGPPRVFFARPNFGDDNAVFAPEAWLWGLDLDLEPEDTPTTGGVAPERAVACTAAGGRTDQFTCVRASAGHPNVAGAQEYARVINALL